MYLYYPHIHLILSYIPVMNFVTKHIQLKYISDEDIFEAG